MTDKQLRLYGRVILRGTVRAMTGLRVGGSAGALEIGGVDLPIIRNSLDQKPYIPGSSLKGKMRSLAEKATGAPQNQSISQIKIHVAQTQAQYDEFWVNPLFGVPSEMDYDIPAPTRLTVRDVPLSEQSAADLNAARTELPYSEMKTEVAIDRITSAATPRQVERVPAGAIFSPMELVLNVYGAGDLPLIDHLLACLQLVEDDYIGGHGSRGSGKVAFRDLSVICRNTDNYTEQHAVVDSVETLGDLLGRRTDIQSRVSQLLGLGGGT